MFLVACLFSHVTDSYKVYYPWSHDHVHMLYSITFLIIIIIYLFIYLFFPCLLLFLKSPIGEVQLSMYVCVCTVVVT